MKPWSPKETPDESTAKAVHRIIEAFGPDRIILFGSRAKGQPQQESDIDLLVIFNDLPREQKRARTVEIYQLLSGIDWPIDVVVANKADLAIRGESIGYIYGPALKEGVYLYERPA